MQSNQNVFNTSVPMTSKINTYKNKLNSNFTHYKDHFSEAQSFDFSLISRTNYFKIIKMYAF